MHLECLCGLSVSYSLLSSLLGFPLFFQPVSLPSLPVLFVSQLPLSLFLLLFHPLSPVFGLLLSETLRLLKLLSPSHQLILGH